MTLIWTDLEQFCSVAQAHGDAKRVFGPDIQLRLNVLQEFCEFPKGERPIGMHPNIRHSRAIAVGIKLVENFRVHGPARPFSRQIKAARRVLSGKTPTPNAKLRGRAL